MSPPSHVILTAAETGGVGQFTQPSEHLLEGRAAIQWKTLMGTSSEALIYEKGLKGGLTACEKDVWQ